MLYEFPGKYLFILYTFTGNEYSSTIGVQWSPSYKAPLANGPPAYTAAFAVL